MGWRPVEFWAATMSEFFDAISAHNELHADPDEIAPPSDDEMAKLLARYG